MKISAFKKKKQKMHLCASLGAQCAGVMEPVGLCTFLHMHFYLCLCASVSVTATRTPAGDTWPHGCRRRGLCCECLCGLAERGDPLCGSPRRRGASCTSLVAPFGPLCLWPPRSDPLGSTKCGWTSALSTSW